MVKISIRLVRDPGISSRIICWWTWGKWSHVEIVTSRGYLGARLNGGVKVRPFGYVDPVEQSIRSIEVTPDQYAVFMAYADKQIGKPYDWFGLLGFGIHHDTADDPEKWFCSEYVTACFEKAGVPILDTSHAYRISPRDVGLSTALT